jgi:hypothetical protein
MSRFEGYDASTVDVMRVYCRSLPEDHRRRYAAVEALKLGHGGVAYVARLLGMSRRTVYFGIRELQSMGSSDPQNPMRPSGHPERIRRRGAGRPKATEQQPGLKAEAERILEGHSAGSPTDETVRWTDLKPRQLAAALVERGYEIARHTAARLLDHAGYRRRALRKELAIGLVDPQERDQQFRHINALRRDYHSRGLPVLCVDTKKKELLGALYRSGQCYCTAAQPVYDHDYPYLATGRVIPHGVYDYFENRGFITLGTSRENSAFICDSIDLAWTTHFCSLYLGASEILLTFDAGGANGVRSLRFKEDLGELSDRLGMRLRVAHYPPYTSKWHPIEHRLFCHVNRALSGRILSSHQDVLEAVESTSTRTGLSVCGRILDAAYDLGRKCSKNFKSIMNAVVRPEPILGKWNYTVCAKGFC